MNVKETHIVTGMSRDSAVSQQNPNLVYDAHNIRITTKDGKNSLLSITNERGTRQVSLTGDSIVGTPIGDAVIDNTLVLFTHDAYAQPNPDHIYKCVVDDDHDIIAVTRIFEGNANFDLEHPIEAQSLFETESIQKVYWVDGKNQPRMINIITDSVIRTTNFLEFSPSVVLQHALSVTKSASGGEFPVGTIQYTFSYFKLNGQETRLIDISPMYYLSPKDRGLSATETCSASFNIVITGADTSFDKIRVYSIVRTQENGTPMCRIVGDYNIQNIRPSVPSGYGIDIIDNGVGGSSIDASSLYFIGGERIIASTLAQKDNTLFLGNIKLNMPNLKEVKQLMDTPNVVTTVVSKKDIGYLSTSNYNTSPIKAFEYYGYEPNNNRSSYYIKAFKYRERYKLGFIAQYENGQWSEPIAIATVTNDTIPEASVALYKRGGFAVKFKSNILKKLKDLRFKRLAPVVVYPRAIGRRTVVQGILCPTVCTYGDRESNAPFAQSSWFFRFNKYKQQDVPGDIPLNFIPEDKAALFTNLSSYGEIQCLDSTSVEPTNVDPTDPSTYPSPSYTSKYSNWFFINAKLSSLHSPDIECGSISKANIDLTDTELVKVGESYLGWNSLTVIDHFLETENAGINTDSSQVVRIGRTAGLHEQRSFCLYADSAVNRNKTDEVSILDATKLYGWVVYPWHSTGSLNNQGALTTKQIANSYSKRTALLKKNITASASFGKTIFTSGSLSSILMKDFVPKIFNSDQLSGISLTSKYGSLIYYGNVDKVITPDNSSYHIMYGWNGPSPYYTITELSQEATGGWHWKTQDIKSDPVSMKYKSSPHIVLNTTNVTFEDDNCGFFWNANTQAVDQKAYRGGLHIVELIRNTTDKVKFGETSGITPDAWIRCGESVAIPSNDDATAELIYMQGDCYFQMYDCLKTYPFTTEDTNSVIEIFSTMLESYVNLDFRYDKNRGASNNVALSPQNFNLFNDSAYNQSGNFFSYHQLDYTLIKDNNFPNTITWSLEKHLGEDIDSWMSIDVSNTEELDGTFGKVNKVVNYNNELYCFQDIGISQLLFNSRVQIPASDGVPIEITNGMKMQGKRYISTKIGCINKWSIVETPMGVYFNDDLLKATYMFNGQLTDLSTTKGMKSWMNMTCNNKVWNPEDFINCKAFYDKVGRDIYWVYGNNALVYSEILGQYMSFMDYGSVPLLTSLCNSTYAITTSYGVKKVVNLSIPFQTEGRVVNGLIVFTLGDDHTRNVNLIVNWLVDTTPINSRPAAEVQVSTSGNTDVIAITIYTCPTYSAELYTLGDILTAIQNGLPSYITAVLTVSGEYRLAYRDSGAYKGINTYMTNNISSPIWELGKGDYNMFFGEHKPYWLTLISNTQPTENKIYNNVAWRDIVTENLNTKPFRTFDHIRVWNEHQDTQSVRFSNSLSIDSNRQPIAYNAAISNLRKKFNVWHCQIPRDKLALNTSRARISNPWTYIKLSREDIYTDRHEIMDIEIDYFM